MATRAIRDDRQRRTTAMLTPFMPSGAKLPVIALFAGVFFQDAAWVGTSMYFVVILVIVAGTLIIAGACYKLVVDKKKGVKCSGCPYSEMSEQGCHCCDQSTLKPVPKTS